MNSLNNRMFDTDRSGTINFDEFWYAGHIFPWLPVGFLGPF